MEEKFMIFCDYDGTITKEETMEALIQQFVEDDIRKIVGNMMERGYTVKQGIKELVGRIPSSEYEKAIKSLNNPELREGFPEFLIFSKKSGIPVVVLSGGIDRMVNQGLVGFEDMICALYSGKVDLSGDYVRFHSDYETDEELVGKAEIMNRHCCDTRICIGDSYTDMRMAMASDIIFARDRLAKVLQKQEIEYFEFNSFFEIIKILNGIVVKNKNNERNRNKNQI